MSGVSNSKIISCRICTVCLENIPMLYEACKTLDIICMCIFVGRTTGIETERIQVEITYSRTVHRDFVT